MCDEHGIGEDESRQAGAADGGRYLAVPGCIRVARDGAEEITEQVAFEVPVTLSYDGVYAHLFSCTPANLDDLAFGYAFATGAIEQASDVLACEVIREGDAIDVDLKLAPCAPRKRGAAMRGFPLRGREVGGVGAAHGKEDCDDSPSCPWYPLQRFDVAPSKPIDPAAIWMAEGNLADSQRYRVGTGSTHAAAFVGRDGSYICLREDVGRHNAVDKLVGAMIRGGLDPKDGFVFLSSRCALELVGKLVRFGVGLIATVSAPTSAAIAYGEACGVTLAAYAREGRFTVYTHPERIVLPPK